MGACGSKIQKEKVTIPSHLQKIDTIFAFPPDEDFIATKYRAIRKISVGYDFYIISTTDGAMHYESQSISKLISGFDKDELDIRFINTSWNDETLNLITNDGTLYEIDIDSIDDIPYQLPEWKAQDITDVLQIECVRNTAAFAICGSLINDAKIVKSIISFWMKSMPIVFNKLLSNMIPIISDMVILKGSVYYRKKHRREITTWTLLPECYDMNIKQIVVGDGDAFLLTDNGNIYAFDPRDAARNEKRLDLEELTYFSEKEIFVTKICCGKEQLMILDRDNKVYTCKMYGLHVEGNIYKPEIIEELVGESIIDIAAIKDRSFDRYYAKSRDGQHFLWGWDMKGQCSLKENECKDGFYQYQYDPLMINDIFYEETGKRIKSVYLDKKRTFIVGSDF